jgi:hypothetical protein
LRLEWQQGRSKVVAAFGRKPLNFRITSGLEATLEQPWNGNPPAILGLSPPGPRLIMSGNSSDEKI